MKRKTLKNLILILGISAMVFSLGACDSNDSTTNTKSSTKSEKPVVTTVSPNANSENKPIDESKIASKSSSSSKSNTSTTSNYNESVAPILGSIGQNWVNASKIMAKGTAIYEDNNKISLCSDFVSIQNSWKEYSNIQATDTNSKNLKIKLDTVRDKQLKAIEKMIYGLDNFDTNSIDTANRLLSESTDIVNSISFK